MKILLIAPLGGVPGGISRWTSHLLNYYKSIEPKDYEIDLVDMGRSSFVNIDTPFFKRLFAATKDYIHIFRDYKRALNNDMYNVLHLTSSGSWSLAKDIYLLRKARKLGIKTVIHFRFGRIPNLVQSRNWEYKLLLKVLSLSDKVIVLDQKTYSALLAIGTEAIILPNPVAPNVLSIVQENRSLLRSCRTILFVGHVVKTKGVFELVKACKQIPNIRLKLIGAILPGIDTEILNLASVNGDSSWVEICGEMPYDRIIQEMLQCAVFVLPTYTEGFPNVILESMACACPIVTTDVGAIPEIMDTKKGNTYGICVKPRDVDALNKAILYMLNNVNFARQCGNEAQKRVSDLYSMPVVWNQLTKIWDCLYSC